MSATLCISFDNLGEASELELGAKPADAPLGGHVTATRIVPSILEELAARDLVATFFVEGLNAEVYPQLLKRMDAAGHEVAFHAWRHEQWGELTAAEQADNLARGVTAFAALDMELAGMRPPGGGLGEGGLAVLREAGLRYCSPAGSGAGVEDGLALLPFQWRHVDATSVLPGLEAVREEIGGSPGPLEPAAFQSSLEADIELLGEGDFATIVLHPAMLDWLGEERLAAILDRIARRRAAGELRVARCADVAEQVLGDAESFRNAATLDPTGWA